MAAQLDYSTAETNFTLGLTQLSGELEHRSIVVVFTDFSDTTSAELMLENVKPPDGPPRSCCSSPSAMRSWRPWRGAEPETAGGCLARRARRRACCASATLVTTRLRRLGVRRRSTCRSTRSAPACSTPISPSSAGAALSEWHSTLKSHRFRAEREADWQRLEDAARPVRERAAARDLSDDEVIAIPVLYRSALSSLSAARAVSLDQNLIAYLESLCTRAYFCVYGTRTTIARARGAASCRATGRLAVQALWRETLVSGAAWACWATSSPIYLRDNSRRGSTPSSRRAWRRDAIPAPRPRTLRKHAVRQPRRRGAGLLLQLPVHPQLRRSRCSRSRSGFAVCLPTAFLLFTMG